MALCLVKKAQGQQLIIIGDMMTDGMDFRRNMKLLCHRSFIVTQICPILWQFNWSILGEDKYLEGIGPLFVEKTRTYVSPKLVLIRAASEAIARVL
jgi:hypothetical protein